MLKALVITRDGCSRILYVDRDLLRHGIRLPLAANLSVDVREIPPSFSPAYREYEWRGEWMENAAVFREK